ncbi:multicopper oxidase-domain-containing protein [Amylocarpus encephaloides]|uniref:Multicopper oxidase-domain-containing protein n=1 Tax=Amylocarpus encephaloides TaxID=45428 RepID=A0A9P7YGP4_9HELO|nr:multicopper oxidase-domain-containing protein [Amylocarpus encephaloides]
MQIPTLVGLLLGSTAQVAAQFSYPNLPVDFLRTSAPVTPLPNGAPWGPRNVMNTNAYDDPPKTGVIRTYDFTIARKNLAPDGFTREFLVINGQFPGPLIEANWGDTIQVTVHNQLSNPEEGTALHWHGILQKTSQWMDGVPAISQCPIPPGSTFTYTFTADLYGSSWYHSHYSAQYAGGIVGPMIIHGPDDNKCDIDLGPVLITDHYHEEYFKLVEMVISKDLDAIRHKSDNNLINGKNNFDCSSTNRTNPCRNNAGISSFKFTPGKTHKLRLINAGAEALQKFSIDGHTMTVISNDFVPLKPYNTKVVTLHVGQRTDVLVHARKHETGSFNMRATIANCSLTLNPNALATVYYGRTRPRNPPTTTPWPEFLDSVLNQCANDDLSLTVPKYPIRPAPVPAFTQDVAVNFGPNATGFLLWSLNGVSFRANYNNPILLLSNLGNNSYPDDPEWNVYNFGSNSSVRFVIVNPKIAAHPIHLHGHNMFVLAAGKGTWDGTITHPNNPLRRDVHILPGFGYLVIQMKSDNPGAWPLHCHIAWHVSSGLYLTVLERPDDIKNLQVPAIMAQTCRDWSAYTGNHIVEQIDSGL